MWAKWISDEGVPDGMISDFYPISGQCLFATFAFSRNNKKRTDFLFIHM
jgi:hypothetical protein